MPTATRLVPALAVLLAAAGCDPFGVDDIDPTTKTTAETFGLASIRSVQLDAHHSGGNINFTMLAELTPVSSGTCPRLADDLTATLNGVPVQLSLYDFSDTVTFSCTIHELDGSVTLPETDARLVLEFKQGARTAVMTIASAAWPAMGPVSLSRAAVPVGETFTVDVAMPGAAPFDKEQLARAYTWFPSVCPREKPNCVPGEGWQGFTPSAYGTRAGGIWFDVPVDPLIVPGQKLLNVMLTSGAWLSLPVTACSGLPSCFGSNQTDAPATFGPLDFEVL